MCLIIPTRGIRQGDPLSPYLFIFYAKGFSSITKNYEEKKWINGIRVANGALKVFHMLFGNDSYLFCKANLIEAERVEELLEKLVATSEKKVNLTKSSIFIIQIRILL